MNRELAIALEPIRSSFQAPKRNRAIDLNRFQGINVPIGEEVLWQSRLEYLGEIIHSQRRFALSLRGVGRHAHARGLGQTRPTQRG